MADLNAGSKICSNCDQDINIASFLVHEAFCLKNFIRCDICNKSFNKNLKEEHSKDFHSKLKCICGEMIEKYILDDHQKYECRKRQAECIYCQISLDHDKIDKHIEACGFRTELCEKCRKYILLKDKMAHELSDCSRKDEIPNKNARGRRQELLNLNRPTSSFAVFPCEFCSKQFTGFRKLIEHQIMCESNFLDDVPSELFRNSLEGLDEDFEQMSVNPRENEIKIEPEISLIPCEFCDEYIDFNFYNEHMKNCKNSQINLNNHSYEIKEKTPSINRKKNFPKRNETEATKANTSQRFSENDSRTRYPVQRVVNPRNSTLKSVKDTKSNNQIKKK